MSAIYCTLSDLEAALPTQRLIEITNDDDPSSTGSVVESVVNAAIAGAGDLIDAYIGKRYPLPLPSVPEILKRLAVDLAIATLFARARDVSGMPEGIAGKRKEALRVLELIMRGEISLGLATTDAAPAPVGPMTSGQRALFPDHRLSRMDADLHWGGRGPDWERVP